MISGHRCQCWWVGITGCMQEGLCWRPWVGNCLLSSARGHTTHPTEEMHHPCRVRSFASDAVTSVAEKMSLRDCSALAHGVFCRAIVGHCPPPPPPPSPPPPPPPPLREKGGFQGLSLSSCDMAMLHCQSCCLCLGEVREAADLEVFPFTTMDPPE